jgi:hypothetical protein
MTTRKQDDIVMAGVGAAYEALTELRGNPL